jgi:hypothetical protein
VTASSLARAASDDMEEVAKIAQQIKQMLQQTIALRAKAGDNIQAARAKIASAAQSAAGGVGTGQQLQVRCGQSEVKLSEMMKTLGAVAERCNDIATQANAVANDTRQWAGRLSS